MRFFADQKGSLLKQKDILHYEKAPTDRVSEMIDSTDPQDQGSVLNSVIQKVSDPVTLKADRQFVPDAGQFYSNLIALGSDRHASGDLVSSLTLSSGIVLANVCLLIIAGAFVQLRSQSL